MIWIQSVHTDSLMSPVCFAKIIKKQTKFHHMIVGWYQKVLTLYQDGEDGIAVDCEINIHVLFGSHDHFSQVSDKQVGGD